MDKPFLIRNLDPLEYLFLREMFYAALHVREGDPPFPKSIIDTPELAKYIANWGRADDIALVATQAGQLVGCGLVSIIKSSREGIWIY